MVRQLIFVVICGVAVYPMLATSQGIPLVNEENKQFQQVRNMFKSVVDDWTVPPSQVTWNPVRIDNNPQLSKLCRLNPSGNYQNPFDCTQFIMCAGNDVWLWTCPAGGSYDPFPDLCVYPGTPPNSQCPWGSIWTYPDIRCETVAQRFFWSVLTLPVNPVGSCGECDPIYYCNNSTQVSDDTRCPPGTGYCKGYLACLELDDCVAVDSYFNFLK